MSEPDWLAVRAENLGFFADLYWVSETVVSKALDCVGLAPQASTRVGGCARGLLDP